MGLIFISHSSRDNAEAEAMRGWLATQGWSEVFLDLDPSAGLAPGQRWRDELRKAGESCSAVVVLVSPHWAASKWCLTEFLFAAQLGKEVFPVLIAPCAFSDLPIELTATYQFADISTPAIRAEGHERLRIGLQRAGLHPGAFGWPPKDEPNRPLFRGLRMLEEPDAAIFFGRDTQITKALDTIRRLRDGAPERMLVILGASGAGKSSFLRAGLLSRLRRDTERFLVLPALRPGRAALTGPTGLQHALGLDGPFDGSAIAAQLARMRAPVVERLRTYASQRADGAAVVPPTVILPIDQAEELFIAGDKEAAAAVAGIVDVIKADANVLLLLTIRSDSFGLLQADPLLSSVPRLPFDLPRMPATALKEVIEGPTRLPGAGVAIDANLTEQLIQDFEGADALPLLAFTLERLVMDHGTDGRLELREYVEEMKGVGGAIRKAVEIAFAKAAEIPGLPRTRAELDLLAQRSFVPGLVRIDDAAAAPKRRVALRRRLPQEALPLIDCLIDQRLLVADTEGAEATVEVSHEAVLRHWRELATWIAERRDELSLSDRVTAAARDWRAAADAAKAEALVHRGERLRAAEKLLLWDDLRREMGDDTVAYIAACRDAETRAEAANAAQRRRQRRLRQWVAGLVAAAAIITVLGAALVVTGQRNLGRTQSLTLARTAERFAEEGDYLRALRLSILAAHDNWLMPMAPEGRTALSSSVQGQKLVMEIRGNDGGVYGATFSRDEGRILTSSSDTARLWNAATGGQVGPALKHDNRINGAVFSKDEGRILTWSDDGTARLWDTATGEQIGPALEHDRTVYGRAGAVYGAVFSKDERRILTWSLDGTARLWDAATGGQIGPALKHDDWVSDAVFSKDEGRILTWSSDGTARLWDAATGGQIGPPLKHDDWVNGAVFSNDEGRILTWSGDTTARLWNAATGGQIGPALKHDGVVLGAVFSKDEGRILTWSSDGTARLWDGATGGQIGLALKHGDTVSGAVFSKDEGRILTWSSDGTVRLWDSATSEQIGPALEHDDAVSGAVFSKDEGRILSWNSDGTVRLWDAAAGTQIGPTLRHDDRVFGAVFSKDEGRILTWSSDGTARLWDAATGGQIGPALKHDDVVSGAAFSKDEGRILTWSKDRAARLWDAATGAQIGPALKHDDAVSGAVFSKDEGRILTWSYDGTARIWDAATGGQIGPALKHDDAVLGAVFSKDEGRILTWSSDGIARLWDAATGGRIGPALKHDDWVDGAVFSKDEGRILTWSYDGTARIWDAATGGQIGLALKHDDAVLSAVFSKDEGRILTRSSDGTARLWDAVTGGQIGPALKHDDVVSGAVFSKDEGRILTWSLDGTARLWDTATGRQIGPALKHDGTVLGVVFSKDEGRVLSRSSDLLTRNSADTARLWDVATGRQIGSALTHDDAVLGAVFSKDEGRILTWSDDNTARLWDAATGGQIGPALKHDRAVNGAVFSKDEGRVLTWSNDGTARLWDVKWAMRDVAEEEFVSDLCREKLVGASVQSPGTPSDEGVFVGVRNISSREAEAAPILRDRVGEDVCAPPPTTWETLRSLVSLPFLSVSE